MNNKKQYEQPALVVYGSVEELTQGKAAGGRLDASFPAGTPDPLLTFS